MNKLDELIEVLKENTGLADKKAKKKKCNGFCVILGIVAVVAAIGAIIYAAYRYFGPSYLEDYDEDYDDDYDDDFFEDEEEDETEDNTEEAPKEDSQE